MNYCFWQPSFHRLADDGFPLARIGATYIAQIHFVVLPGESGTRTDEIMDSPNCGSFFTKGTNVEYLST